MTRSFASQRPHVWPMLAVAARSGDHCLGGVQSLGSVEMLEVSVRTTEFRVP